MSRVLISVLGGLAGMLGWGTSDFFANIASEKFGHRKTLLYSQVAGLILIVVIGIFFIKNFSISFQNLILMFLCALAYTAGYLFFYKAFEIGNVSVVSALINLQTIFVVLIAFFLFGQPATRFFLPSFLLILIGVTLVSVVFDDLKKKVSFATGTKEVLIATVLFGVFFVPLNEHLAEIENWLVVTLYVKLFAVIIVLIFSKIISKETLSIKSNSFKNLFLLFIVGVLEALAVLGVNFGLSFGDGIIVMPISSSLTVITVTLAFLFTKERPSHQQKIGIFLTVLGIILISV